MFFMRTYDGARRGSTGIPHPSGVPMPRSAKCASETLVVPDTLAATAFVKADRFTVPWIEEFERQAYVRTARWTGPIMIARRQCSPFSFPRVGRHRNLIHSHTHVTE